MNRRVVLNTLAASAAMLVASQTTARPLHFLLEKKVKAYRAKVEAWAQSPDIIAMARAGFNKSDPALASADWKSRSVPRAISVMLNNDVSRKMAKLARDPAIAKLTLLNSQGDVLGSAGKPRDYNLGDTLAFNEAIYGGLWSANRSRIDPVLNKYLVGLSAPIFDRNREVGVLYMQLFSEK